MTGLLRKVPEMKIKYSKEELKRLMAIQETLLASVDEYLSNSGKIVYSTSSLLEEENLFQAAKFCQDFDFEIYEGKHFQTYPDAGLLDGYFSVTLQRKHN